MTKHLKTKFLIFLVLLFIFIFPLIIVSAASSTNLTYEPMEVLPGFAKTADFVTFISNLYKFGIWTVGICALIMIVIGGYMYAASGGNNASMEKAKTFITDALVGLVLALLAYLILYIINPELIKIKMSTISTTTTTTTPAPTNCTGPVPPNSTICTSTSPTTSTAISLVATCATPPASCTYKCNDGYNFQGGACVAAAVIPSTSLAAAATSLLGNTKVTYSSTGDCKNTAGESVTPNTSMASAKGGTASTYCNSTCNSGSRTPCTGTVSLSIKLLDTLNAVGKTNSFRISSLTGGQHTASSDHYSGKAADVVPSANKSEWTAIVSQFTSAGCSNSFCDKGGNRVSCSAADHIHVSC